ncbi:sirohydrochlorin chelatase [Jeotgalibacillus sp. S-D1]|uniref:sirohydrochlorin chelatase n=1 Tax=Jeotgalibacillus sp. S-D1 TaxID=2552189 RepID=UPI00105A7D40|nr:sirohydrochlorin chelatase [Jeotgalibacillus sp. S-D1]TDL30775.1 sirohydrochlorin chelatase [Jeotgalibacillus sp. S-D1]
MKAILYIGHGTRSKKGAAEAKQFLQTVINRVDAPIQEISFLELTEPFIDEGFRRCVERGATEIKVVPIFLLTAGHIKEDIPQALAPLLLQYPEIKVDMTESFGVQTTILDAIAELVNETAGNLTPSDSLLVVGRGSSDPETRIAFGKITEGIQNRLGIARVRVCYLAAIEPRLDQGLADIVSEAGEDGRILVVPYLLFGGLLLSEVKQKVLRLQKQGHSIIHTDSLSKHSIIQEIVVNRASSQGATACSH